MRAGELDKPVAPSVGAEGESRDFCVSGESFVDEVHGLASVRPASESGITWFPNDKRLLLKSSKREALEVRGAFLNREPGRRAPRYHFNATAEAVGSSDLRPPASKP